MLRCSTSRWALSAILSGIVTQAAAGQSPSAPPVAAPLALTSTSETARREFRRMLAEIFNLRPVKARQHGLNAVAADPAFGLPRIHLARATVSPELSVAARLEEASRGLALLSTASAPEVLLGLYARETIAARTAAALPILQAAAQMAPGDPDVDYMLLVAERPGKSVVEVVARNRAFIAKYPDFAGIYNGHAYSLQSSGDPAGALAAARRQVELLPDHANAHDTWADILLLQGHVDEAWGHTEASLRLDSTYANAYTKQGTIALIRGQHEPARASFRRAAEVAGTAPARVQARYWIASSYLYQHDVASSLRELVAAENEATTGNAPVQQRAAPHLWMAVIEAMVGDKGTVQAHLAKAAEIAPANALNQTLYATLAYAAVGKATAAAALANARAYRQAAGANSAFAHTLDAAASLASGDTAGAERALAGSSPNDLLAKTLRAEVLKAKGQTADARALRDEVLRSAIKLDANGPVDFAKLVARLRAEKL